MVLNTGNNVARNMKLRESKSLYNYFYLKTMNGLTGAVLLDTQNSGPKTSIINHLSNLPFFSNSQKSLLLETVYIQSKIEGNNLMESGLL